MVAATFSNHTIQRFKTRFPERVLGEEFSVAKPLTAAESLWLKKHGRKLADGRFAGFYYRMARASKALFVIASPRHVVTVIKFKG